MNLSSRVTRLILPFLVLALVACSCPFNLMDGFGRKEPGETEAWQSTVTEFRSLVQGQQLPVFLTDPELPQDGEVFNPNRLLDPLTHLSLMPGYSLDFVYQFDGMGGHPILYARKESDPPFETLEDYERIAGDCDMQDQPAGCDYVSFIVTDGTEQSYFEWVLLMMMGDQFYLYWHSGYNDAQVVASTERLEALVEKIGSNNFGYPLTAAQKRQALRIDPAPEVTVGSDAVQVRVVWFTMWGGFYETIYSITSAAPHQILDSETNNLVEYDCGIMF